MALAALVFDMDGVLVDPSASYRAVVVECVRRFVRDELQLAEPPVDLRWPSALKAAGGFNNDWDLSAALVRAVVAEGPALDPDDLGARLRAAGGGLTAVDALFGEAGPQLDARGPIQDLFQQLYLGDALYRQTYGRAPDRVSQPGFIEREQALISPEVLLGLALPLGVATGRPRSEAHHAITTFGFDGVFRTLVTHDDVVEAGRAGKPDPWCVLEALRPLGVAPAAAAYVGDTPDDMRAAVRGRLRGFGVAPRSEHAALREVGAECCFESTAAFCDAVRSGGLGLKTRD